MSGNGSPEPGGSTSGGGMDSHGSANGSGTGGGSNGGASRAGLVAKPVAAVRGTAFRFLHASDLSLQTPLQGISDYPPAWQSVLASASYTAATRVFDAAIAERVAFVLLSGNVVDLDFCGPRAIAFLMSQFERLGQRGIAVYWCGGQQDHLERWPTAIELPDNVHLFASTLVDSVAHQQGTERLATIYGAAADPHRSSFKDFQGAAGSGFPIGLTYGVHDPVRLAGHGIRYWALGGKDKRDLVTQPGMIVAYPGAVQGRERAATGPHGAILVSVDSDGQVRTQSVECDAVRWLSLGLTVAESIHMDALKDLLADRALQVLSKVPDGHLLVDWHIATTGDYAAEFRRQENRLKLLKWLRHEFGSSPGLWSVGLTFSAPQNLPKGWQEEDTILGDYLREVSKYRQESKLPFHLAQYAGGQDEVEGVTRLTRVDSATREAVLDAALMDGIDRLGGNQT